MPSDLWVISCYFNPAGFETKLANYRIFAEALGRAGVNYRVVECAFGDSVFSLPASEEVIQVRARDVMWQKERLLNAAMGHLPPQCTKVAWLDCDVLFANAKWAQETSDLLERFAIVQPFDRVIRLPRGHRTYQGEGDLWPSFVAVAQKHPNLMLAGDFARHGHTGFAWAARRSLLERHGLYDACISGSGDHMMAHAFCGDWASPCIDRILGADVHSAHRAHFTAWCRSLYSDVRARVGVVSGALMHLWHGEMEHRRYVLRNQELAGFGFDPAVDLRAGAGGAWEWNSDKPELHQWALQYYPSRREDG